MRFAAGCLVSALVLASVGAVGVVGPWALPAAAVVVLFASVVAAVAMERRDFLSIDAIVASAALAAPDDPASPGALPPLGEVG